MNIRKNNRFLTITLLSTVILSSCAGKRGKSSDSSKDAQNVEATGQYEKPKAVHPLDFKLYMERSGSMVSYDSKDSKGDFKKIVSSLLNKFPKINSNDSTSVYIVNDNVYPYEGTVKDFLAQRDFFSSTKDIGNPSYTDFDKIFEMILADTKKYQVSALVTDLIYSTNGQEETTSNKLLNEAYALTHNVFKGKTSTSVIVIQFEADYSGPYYPYNSPGTGIQYSGSRPFYVLLFASKDSMEELYNTQDYTAFTHFSDLPGYENMFTFTDLKFNPQYTVVMDYDFAGHFRKGRENKKDRKGVITSIENARLAKDNSKMEIPIAIDLSSLPLSNDYKKESENYEVQSEAGYKISSIKAIDNLEESEIMTVRKALPSATHLLILETKERPHNEKIEIKMIYSLPGWIRKSSSSDDTNLKSDDFDDTTFGFEEVMRGIYDAYVPDGTHRCLFEISLDVKKK